MHLRKTRQPAQGLTNLNRSSNSLSELPMMTQTHVWDKTNSKFAKGVDTSLYYSAKTHKNITKNKPKYSNADQTKEISSDILNSVRKAYKGKPNIWKIAKTWKFPQKGYIKREQLKEQLQKYLKQKISDKQCSEMFNFFSGNTDKLDLQQFLSLIYSQPKDSVLKPKLYDVKDEKKQRNSKIINLVDHIEEKKEQNNTTKDYNLTKKGLFRRQKSVDFQNYSKDSQNCFFSKDHFSALSQTNLTKKHLLNSKILKQNFDPSFYADKNQKKTRFGATPSTLMEKNDRQEDNISTLSSSMQNQRNNAVDIKLEKIREYQRIEKQNICNIEMKQKSRDDANLLRKRLQKEAYEYSAFIKNKWL